MGDDVGHRGCVLHIRGCDDVCYISEDVMDMEDV
jgi:hypothetical protein